jgi:site-specific DNA-methyltransferase (adenine-specific)
MKCEFCGASKDSLNRDIGLETHAYAFIHHRDIQAFVEKTFGGKMQFDVVIGNPPYQLDDGGFGTSAGPIYDKFVEQAKKLDPRLLTMVIPARWFSGGKGLDSFRDQMLNDRRIRSIDDFPDSSEVFPGVQIKGGVCYFLWDRDNPGDCRVTNHLEGVASESVIRPLLETGADTFIRYNAAIPILKKVIAFENSGDIQFDSGVALRDSLRFSALVSPRKPFGLDTAFKGIGEFDGSVKVYRNGGVGYARRSEITKNVEIVDHWKVFIPYAGSGSDAFPHPILGRPFLGEPGSACSETYLFIGPFESKSEAQNVITYLSSQLVRFLVLLHKPSQHATSSVYAFVPMVDFSISWSDGKLCKRYEISKSEFEYIETLVRPMELDDE